MNARRRRALLTAVAELLEHGEQVEVTSLVNLSEVSVKRNLATGLAAAVLSGGMTTVAATPQPMYRAATGERLFLFQANQVFAKPDRHVATFRISDVKRSEVKRGLVKHSFVLLDEARGSALRIFFPPVSRKDVAAVAGRIPVVTAWRDRAPGSPHPQLLPSRWSNQWPIPVPLPNIDHRKALCTAAQSPREAPLHRRRRSALTVSAALLCAAPLLAACGSQAHPGAAAVVGGDRITVSTVQAQVADVREAQSASPQTVQAADQSGQLARAKLHGLILDRVLDRAAADAGVTVSRAEIQQMRQSAAAQYKGEKGLRAAVLQERWIAPGQIDAFLREQIQLTKLGRALGADPSTPAGTKVLGDALSKASKALKVDVNPRFGKWNNQQIQLGDYKAPWITQVTKPEQPAAAAGA